MIRMANAILLLNYGRGGMGRPTLTRHPFAEKMQANLPKAKRDSKLGKCQIFDKHPLDTTAEFTRPHLIEICLRGLILFDIYSTQPEAGCELSSNLHLSDTHFLSRVSTDLAKLRWTFDLGSSNGQKNTTFQATRWTDDGGH